MKMHVLLLRDGTEMKCVGCRRVVKVYGCLESCLYGRLGPNKPIKSRSGLGLSHFEWEFFKTDEVYLLPSLCICYDVRREINKPFALMNNYGKFCMVWVQMDTYSMHFNGNILISPSNCYYKSQIIDIYFIFCHKL